MMSTNQTSNSTGGMNGTTTTNNTSMSMISCPSFTCNYSDCYTMYNDENTSCTTGGYCQLIRQTDMCYTVGCSASCVDRCVNASQSNCSVSCCNSTGCLNGSFASMMMTTTTVISTMTTTTTQATTTTTTTTTSPKTDATSATSANNGKKCHKGKCNGTTCYKSFGSLETCTSSQPHCQLKKETINSILQWTAGCTTNCSGQTTCKTESRLLGLVESTKEHAIFIYTHRRMAITADDVSLEDIIPISLDFAVVEVSSPEELAVVGGDTRVRVSYQEDEIELRLPFGSHSRLFLSEVNRAWSDVCKSPTQVPKFEWTNKYHKPTRGQGVVKQALSPFNTTITKTQPAPENRWPHTDKEAEEGKTPPTAAFSMGRSQTHWTLVLPQNAWERCKEMSKVMRDSEKSSDKRGNLEKEKGSNSATQKSKAYPSPESQGIPSREDRDDMVRSSSHTPSNKAQILAMPQFGLRDNLIRCELLKNEDLYTYLEDFSFFLGTYNVNGQTPKESLRPWLSCTLNPPDMYCVGFQELDLSKEAFFFNDTPKELEWTKAVSEALHPDAKYALVKLVRLVGIMLIFYVKKQHAEFISDVEAETVGTGIMGRMGNKGAVAIRFRFHNSDICVVNSHLAAHIEEYERRNQDYKDICGRLQFRQLDPTQPPLTIMKHDVILWIGDLNYRISDLDVDNVKELISKNEFETLHNYDQLKRQIDEEAVFVGFVEGEINFQPTYKYDTGSDQWDTSEKCRVPAWCDRILWRGKNIKQQHYQSHMALKTSDHKPVSSLLVTGIKRVNSEDYKKTFEEIVRNIDKMENECIPSVTLAKQEFHFKDVKYMQHQAETLSLFNDGQVPCQFEFIQKPNEPTYCKPWLTANPPKGFIAQGGSVDIELEVFVNRSTAPDLNCGKEQIEDILVLHLERGKDYFISVTGNYLPSCFGTSIRSLCHMREPIHDMPQSTLRELVEMSGNENVANTEKPLDIPKELWMMVDHLFRNAIKQEDIFQQPGLRSEFADIRDCLDTGMPDTLPGSNHSVAEALLLFLDALPEPVVPFSFYQQCLESCVSATQCEKTISMLPQCHQNVFNYLAAFLRELLKNSASNRLDVNILATIFASLLLRSPTKQELAEKRKTQEFFQHFLTQGST
ncbi:Type II inositol 1,4,5-trisphosphate 5-phosphatase [Larimichthys crocea]|uniref:phosphoinositide 5-phosphatase n=1 Tax=Larimichthys crocea TaxID=215358 RepID=A0A6G0IC47_LARCR|nr:Type II inositol 1,4,5-trisphosphate 5-phosphatase [Larimichthys crocea]